ncbi:MAG: ATP-binding protein [Jaaginema sp. PMC 1079.18]|nr:ATP-binding protein [Jaaginema sp. PMC 1080.18]MEC4853455.1 ATP-binding protein [Jaaginema sp. PMC 1079.18]MEC4866400.1 ATP-binding protein [Jaaginema sp. PMC 1078.18]
MRLLSTSENIVSKRGRSPLQRGLSRLAVRQKIAWGYITVMGVVVLGVVVGKIIEGSYRQQAQHHFESLNQQVFETKAMQYDLLEIQIDLQNLPQVLTLETDEFVEEYEHILEHKEIFRAWYESLGENETQISQDFRAAFFTYEETLEELANSILANPPQTPQELTIAKNRLNNFITSEVSYNLGRSAHDLDEIIVYLKEQQEQAILDFNQTQKIGTFIVIASVVLAIIVALALIFYISNAIARPLQKVTQVTRQITKNSDFTLQAPVTTEDEIGELSIALNQLIRSIYDYTNELKSTQSQLIQTEKMSSLGQMVAGIAHEINNPVGFIYGNIAHAEENIKDLLHLIEMYQQENPNPSTEIAEEIAEIDLDFIAEDLPNILNSIKMGTERIREIAVSLRNFARIDDVTVKSFDIHQGIDSTLVILHNRLKKEIKVTKNYGDLPPIECYPSQLNQVWMNLISNAIDALETEKAQDSNFKPEITITTEITEGDRVLVNIQDNGPGIPPEIQAKVFEAFYTTKPIGKGTGLGLSICSSIIEKHQGNVTIKSQPQQGTKFAIALPITQTETVLTPTV